MHRAEKTSKHEQDTVRMPAPIPAGPLSAEEILQGSPRMVAQRQLMHTLFGASTQLQETSGNVGFSAQRQAVPTEEPGAEPLQAKSTQIAERASAKPNNTGLPAQLKIGIESLSGMSLDHVRVHYNSSQPAQLNAHAYAQGSDIHVASGQEHYLPHEAWHIVQQAQGRVKPTTQMKTGVSVNDDAGLEIEADVMGAKALQLKSQLHPSAAPSSTSSTARPVIQRGGQVGKFARTTEHSLFGPKDESEGGVWIVETDGANGKHQQLRVGETRDNGYAQTFGLVDENGQGRASNPLVSPGRGEVSGEGMGAVYEDYWPARRTVQFFPLSKEEQGEAISDLKKEVGTKGDYNVINNNCVHYSMTRFDRIKTNAKAKRRGSNPDDGIPDLPPNFSFGDF